MLSFPGKNFAQAPVLGTAANFVLFTVNGAVGNTGISRIKGNIGTNSGAIGNFTGSVVIGTTHTADALTAQCTSDLMAAYAQLNAATTTFTHMPVLGNGETLYNGVYTIASAASVVSVLNLDAQGDSNAVFIFKTGGAFTTAATATINLVNGAIAANIFWIAEGEIAMAALTSMKGTLIAHNGAISLGAGGMLEGRMFSTSGAIAIDAISATIRLPFPDVNILQAPNLGTAANFVLFTTTGAVGNTGISQVNGSIGSNDGAISGFGSSTINGTIYNADATTIQCSADLLAAYNQLIIIDPTATHLPVLGNGETLYPGVYALAAAGSLIATLTLDAQGDPNAIFIFKTGGAFTTAASATVNLVNGASACNVFWVAEGAIAMAASTSMKGTLISHNGAISMGAGGILEGRMFSTTGAASVYGVLASIPVGCSVNTYWTGAAGTADWFTSGNWTRGIPDGIMGTWIPTTLLPGRLFPVINAGIATVDTLTIQTAATLTLTNSTLQIKGAVANTGILNAAAGSIEMTGSSSQSVVGNTFQNNAVNNLIISNSSAGGVILNGALDIYNALSYTGTSMKLITNDSLTLKSTASNTATIGVMTGNTITGAVTVERYIPANKAWRFLSIPTNTTQTIKETWQEGAIGTGSNPLPNHGTQITSDLSSWAQEGFDLYSANGPSMKMYNPSTHLWDGITGTGNNIKTAGGYMTFIRGDRTANSFNSVPTETILRTRGELYIGDQPAITANAGQFTAIGNPYPSVLDMRNISKDGIKDFFYIWDPNLASSSGYGAYQTFAYDGNNYIVIPGLGSYGAGGTASNYIQSGQAFFVQAKISGGSVHLNEAAKMINSSRTSVITTPVQPQLRVSLYGVKPDNSVYVVDGLLINYGENYSNAVDDMDAIKSPNTSENLSIKNENSFLVVEKRHTITGADTIFLDLRNTKIQRYRFEFTATQLLPAGSTAFLEDNYLHIATALDPEASTIINFSIENIAASYASNRFRIVFISTLMPLPVTFTSIKAFRKNDNINIDWKVEQEINVKQFEVEHAGDNTRFKTIFITVPAEGSISKDYFTLDTNPANGINYYRVKAVDLDGKTTYTNVAKLFFEKDNHELSIFPNPVVDGVINLQLNNMPAGEYVARLKNNQGQTLLEKIIQHNERTKTEIITMDKNWSHAIYVLQIIKPGGRIDNLKVFY